MRDDGIGMTEERLKEVKQLIKGEWPSSQESSGFGLFNVNQRIWLYYGPEYGLTVESIYHKGTELQIVIPAVKK